MGKDIEQELSFILAKYDGKTQFTRYTLNNVRNDSLKAKRLIEKAGNNEEALEEIEEAIKLSSTGDENDNRTITSAIGSLEQGIRLFFGRG